MRPRAGAALPVSLARTVTAESQSSAAGSSDKDVARGSELVKLGAETLSGLGIGLVVGGPIGAAAGAATPIVTRVLALVGHQIRDQFGPREEIRIGGALGVALERIRERLDAGQKPRDDGLFEPGADPEGLLEGTLRAAAGSYEEKKIPYIGAFYASLAFDKSVSPASAQMFIRLLDRLSYRQFVALAYLDDPGKQSEREQIDAAAKEGEAGTPADLEAELGELANMRLVGFRQEDGGVAHPLATYGGGQVHAHSMATTALTGVGQTFTRLAELDRIPAEDREAFAAELREGGL
jgi:hypothetical protein